MRTRSLAPLAALAVAGCMASKSDIALLQTDLQTMRTESARGDSARFARTSQATITPLPPMAAAIAVVLPPGAAHRSSRCWRR